MLGTGVKTSENKRFGSAILLHATLDLVVCALRAGAKEWGDPSGASSRPGKRPRTGVAKIEAAHSARAEVRREDSRDRFVLTPPDIIELTKIPELVFDILFE